MGEPRLTQEQIRAAQNILRHGDRVELIPVKDGVRVLRVRREEMGKSPSKMPEKT